MALRAWILRAFRVSGEVRRSPAEREERVFRGFQFSCLTPVAQLYCIDAAPAPFARRAGVSAAVGVGDLEDAEELDEACEGARGVTGLMAIYWSR